MVCDNLCKLTSYLEGILVGMDWYDNRIDCNFHTQYAAEVVALIGLNSLVLCAFKVKENPFFFTASFSLFFFFCFLFNSLVAFSSAVVFM